MSPALDRPVADPVPERPPDIVVVGGGGHVGLPLSLRLAESGARVDIYDIAQRTLERIGGGQVPFSNQGRRTCCAVFCPLGGSCSAQMLRSCAV